MVAACKRVNACVREYCAVRGLPPSRPVRLRFNAAVLCLIWWQIARASRASGSGLGSWGRHLSALAIDDLDRIVSPIETAYCSTVVFAFAGLVTRFQILYSKSL